MVQIDILWLFGSSPANPVQSKSMGFSTEAEEAPIQIGFPIIWLEDPDIGLQVVMV